MPPPRWYVTLAQGEGLCSDCGAFHRHRDPVLYSHGLRRLLCLKCGEERGIVATPSRSYLGTGAKR